MSSPTHVQMSKLQFIRRSTVFLTVFGTLGAIAVQLIEAGRVYGLITVLAVFGSAITGVLWAIAFWELYEKPRQRRAAELIADSEKKARGL